MEHFYGPQTKFICYSLYKHPVDMKYRTTNETVSESYLDVTILHPDDHVVGEDLVQLDQ